MSNLLYTHWNIPLSTTFSLRRLGKEPRPGQALPLLVNLPDEATAARILDNAKVLRGSSDPTVRAQVYVNQDLTKGERLAAFELRSKRRRAGDSGLKSTSAPPSVPSFVLSAVSPPSPADTMDTGSIRNVSSRTSTSESEAISSSGGADASNSLPPAAAPIPSTSGSDLHDSSVHPNTVQTDRISGSSTHN